MNWRNIKLIFLREVRDQLRDRRTLFMVAVLPLLMYPALGWALLSMANTFAEQVRTVVMLGAADLPDPPLIEGDRFIADYFAVPDDASTLRVVSDQTPPDQLEPEISEFLQQAREYRPLIEELAKATEALKSRGPAPRSGAPSPDASEAATLERRFEELRVEIGDWFNRSPVQVLIVVPTGYRERIAALNAELAKRDVVFAAAPAERPIILQNSAVDKSVIAFRRVREALRNWEDKLLEHRLQEAHLPSSLHTPFNPTDINLAQDDQISASFWSKLFPVLLVIMAITGAFYPAIDVGAGEKERGTMETLLICPATRTEIVAGKFLTVMVFSLTTALLNLVSMGLTGKYSLLNPSSGSSAFGSASLPPPSVLIWIVVLAVPLAALFSALSLAFAMFARSSKEGQYYLTPLLTVTIGLAVLCASPTVEITPYYSVLPVMGPALLLKALLLGSTASVGLSIYFAPVLLSSFAYSALALWWATELFRREAVLFREADRLELGLWLRHVFHDKQATPSFAEAVFCFVLIVLLQFAALSPMSEAFLSAPDDARQVRILEIQMIYLLATVATPALMMAAVLTSDFRRTLKLYWPGWRMLATSIALAGLLLPVSQELIRALEGWFFPQLPEGAARLMEALHDPNMIIWLPLLAFAVVPAVCEELAFRGFILSGMQRSGRFWLPILLSSVAFGVIHMIPQQVFNATLLGIVLGILAIRSGSLIPGLVFHLLFNGTQVILARVDPTPLEQGIGSWFFTVEKVGEHTPLRYDWPLLVLCVIVAALLLRWTLRQRPALPAVPGPATEPTPPRPREAECLNV